ncbi:MAG: hypothetical protein ACJ8R9_05605 [Steroidobacteraceae bacterium]
MDVKFTTEAILHISRDELRVIGLALAGKLKTSKDKQAAADLNRCLLEARLQNCQTQAEVVRGALAKLDDGKVDFTDQQRESLNQLNTALLAANECGLFDSGESLDIIGPDRINAFFDGVAVLKAYLILWLAGASNAEGAFRRVSDGQKNAVEVFTGHERGERPIWHRPDGQQTGIHTRGRANVPMEVTHGTQ